MDKEIKPKHDGQFYGNNFRDKKDSMPNAKERKPLTSIISNAFENSTAHGISNIYRSETLAGKIGWSILFICAVAVLLIQSKDLIVKYLTGPVDVLFDIKYSNALAFPAVTLCNVNPIRLSMVENIDDDHFRESNKRDEDDKCNDLHSLPDQNFDSNSGQDDQIYEGWDYILNQDDPYNSESTTQEQREKLRYIIAQKNEEQLKQLGHQLKDLLVSCSWAGYSCSYENFTWDYFSSFHGNCYTFNINSNKTNTEDSWKPKKIKSSGPTSGLRLMLFVEQDEYLSGISSSAGVRVVIHDQDRMPFPEDEGYFVPPGFHTSIALRKVEIERLSRDNNVCKSSSLYDDYEDYYTHYGVEYSQQTCMKTCYQRLLMNRCGCYDLHYPNNETALKKEERSIEGCNLRDNVTEECIETFSRNFADMEQGCECDEPCRKISYTTDMSMSYWPAENYKESLKDELYDFSFDLRTILEDDCNGKDSIRKNLLLLDVYYQDLNYEVIKQVYTYKETDLIGALGGLVGLWLGLSILTVFEGLELLFKVTQFFFYKMVLRNNKQFPPLTQVRPADSPKDSKTIFRVQ